MTRAILVTGAGGVGKTTVAGALGRVAAAQGHHTLVVTVDPALRLAQALGVVDLRNEPTPVLPGLEAAMLDAAASWEALVRRHTDEATADRLVASRFFRAIADRFPGGQAYAVADETAKLVSEGGYDIIVVDTPPIGGGADFFEAPGRIRSLVAGKALRILTGPPIPGRRALYRFTARPALRLADRILGGPLLEDLGSFLVDLRSTYDGIRRRAAEVERTLGASDSIVVTTPDPGPVAEAESLLAARSARARLVVVNRVVPATWVGTGNPKGDPYDASLADWAKEALRHQAVVETLTAHGASVSTIPWRSIAPTSLDALLELGNEARLDALL